MTPTSSVKINVQSNYIIEEYFESAVYSDEAYFVELRNIV